MIFKKFYKYFMSVVIFENSPILAQLQKLYQKSPHQPKMKVC